MRKTIFVGTLLGIFTFAAPAVAADFHPMPSKAPAMAVVGLFSWTGFYFDLNAGYGFGGDDESGPRASPIWINHPANPCSRCAEILLTIPRNAQATA